MTTEAAERLVLLGQKHRSQGDVAAAAAAYHDALHTAAGTDDHDLLTKAKAWLEAEKDNTFKDTTAKEKDQAIGTFKNLHPSQKFRRI